LTGDSCGDKATHRRIAFSGKFKADQNQIFQRATEAYLNFMLHLLNKKNICSELLGFWTSPFVWYSKKLEYTTFQKLDLLLSSGEV
jgi:hypothetical protein